MRMTDRQKNAESGVCDSAFKQIWSSLKFSSGSDEEGWRYLRTKSSPDCLTAAGVKLPGNEEAILFGFPERIPSPLPQGQGFSVESFSEKVQGSTIYWVALGKAADSSEELFIFLVNDLLRLSSQGNWTPKKLLARVREWQHFMEKRKTPYLSSEEEIGLWGELQVLKSAIGILRDGDEAVAGWKGPDHGLHDFIFEPRAALEVKTTAGVKGLKVHIDSLDQLDSPEGGLPLFLSVLQVSKTSNGQTLEEVIDEIRSLLPPNSNALSIFNLQLCRAGWLDGVTQAVCRYSLVKMILYRITQDFPCLSRSNAPEAVLTASYTLNLDCRSILENAEITGGERSYTLKTILTENA